MRYFKRRKILKSISAFDLIPVRVHGHDIVDDKVVILVPKFESKWVHKLFPRTAQLFYRIKLDESGSITWENISGDRTVADIILIVQNQLAENARSMVEADERIAKFMTLLYDWRYITFRQII